MAAYFVANYRVTNPEGYANYVPVVGPTLAAHGAEVLAADSAGEVVEGEPRDVTVVLKFASKEAARAWYNSPEYQDVVHFRTDNSEGHAVIVDGFVRPE